MVGILQDIDPLILVTLEEVKDPEIPVLSIVDLGIIRRVESEGGVIHVDVTPTYTGCPAMDTIRQDIMFAFAAKGKKAVVSFVLTPAWTTDMISDKGKKALREYGIAIPIEEGLDKEALLDGEQHVECTHCQSTRTEVISQFGSTACKALFKCLDCLEPFDYFKCHR